MKEFAGQMKTEAKNTNFNRRRLLAVGGFCLPFFSAKGLFSAASALEFQISEGGTYAGAVRAAVNMIENLVEEIAAFMTAQDTTQSEKQLLFHTAMAENMALKQIGRVVLGPNIKLMTDIQIEEYDSKFPRYITGHYAEQFNDILDYPMVTLAAKAISNRNIIVRTEFTRNDGSNVKVDWRVLEFAGREQKIIDIIVSGVSIVIVKRDEFSAYIEQNGVDALLREISK